MRYLLTFRHRCSLKPILLSLLALFLVAGCQLAPISDLARVHPTAILVLPSATTAFITPASSVTMAAAAGDTSPAPTSHATPASLATGMPAATAAARMVSPGSATPFSMPAVSPVPTASRTLASTPMPTAMARLAEGGVLWLGTYNTRYVLAYDLATGATRQIAVDKSCGRLRPGATTVICEDASGQSYALDLQVGRSHPLPIGGLRWSDWTPDGRLLYYESDNSDGASTRIATYDPATGVTHTLVSRIADDDQRGWVERPALSMAGLHLIVVRGLGNAKNAVDLIQDGGELYHPIGLAVQVPTWDYAWSPVAQQLVYGVGAGGEGGYSAHQLYLVDMSSGQTRLLASTDQQHEYGFQGQPIWSPDGTRLAVQWHEMTSRSVLLCVIAVASGEQDCQSDSSAEVWQASALAWSPSGRYIALPGARAPGTLQVYDSVAHRLMTLAEGLHVSSLGINWIAWR